MKDYTIELDREEDGRWIAEIPEFPGVMVYGDNEDQALKLVMILAKQVIEDSNID